jgi:hypothetical protein
MAQDVLQAAVTYYGREAAWHVGYELRQLAALPNLHDQAERDGKHYVARACLESMLLHARNLIEFVIEGRTGSDIHRSDYVQKWAPEKSPATRRLRSDRQMLDKALSHLSWERVKGGTPVHDPARIARDVVEEWVHSSSASRRTRTPLPSGSRPTSVTRAR